MLKPTPEEVKLALQELDSILVSATGLGDWSVTMPELQKTITWLRFFFEVENG
jgi:hypothetical protein